MLSLFKPSIMLLCIAMPWSAAVAESTSDELADYNSVEMLSGFLSSVGSDTLANLMVFWVENFKRLYPQVNFQIQTAGSNTAPSALIDGRSNLAPMSRKMSAVEVKLFKNKFGYEPTEITVAIDALAVYVHKDNPVKRLTIAQVDDIFSINHICSEKNGVKRIETWDDLDGGDALNDQVFKLYGRNELSGTHDYFKKIALCRGEYKTDVIQLPDSASIVKSVAASINGIGYSGIGYKTSSVKAVPLALKEGQDSIQASNKNVRNGTYPLARFLYIYVNKQPNKALPLLEKEFLKMILSRQGQKVVSRDGFISLSSELVILALERL